MPRAVKATRVAGWPGAAPSVPRNLLLDSLPPAVVRRLEPEMRVVNLRLGSILHTPGQTIKDVYFPLDCLISITVTMGGGRTTEAGIVGSREMVGINAFMGGRETNQTEYICQASGTAVRMPAKPLLATFDRNKSVRDVMLRYSQAYIAQLSQNVACNRLHSIELRLARWLLECRDRLGRDDLVLTHKFMGQMLGVRRAGVTQAAAKHQKRGLIRIGHGNLQVLDVRGLEGAACECFWVIREEYDRLLGLEKHKRRDRPLRPAR